MLQIFANKHRGTKKQHHLKVFLDGFLWVHLQNTVCLWCTVIQPDIWPTLKRNLPFCNPQVKGEASGNVVILIGIPLSTEEWVIHLTVLLSRHRPVLCCTKLPMSCCTALPAHCNGEACRQLPLGTSDYSFCVASPLSNSAQRSCHGSIISVWL